MIESFVITLREGIEAALIISIILTYLKKIGRTSLSRYVYIGLFLAVAASIVGAVIFQHIPINEEAFGGIVLLIAAVFVGSMLIWMMRTAKGMKGEIESRVGAVTASIDEVGGGTGKQGFGLLFLTFLMVFREGIETVIFLSAVSLTTRSILSFFGGIAGLGASVAFGVFFVKGSFRINLKRFFSITTAVLFVVVVQLLINALHELSEAGILPSGQREMAIVGPIVRNNVLFLVIMLALPLIMLFSRSRQATAEPLDGLTDAERRKATWQMRRDRRWRTTASVATSAILLLLVVNHIYSSSPKALSPAQPVAAINGEIRIPITSLEIGVLYRYSYDANRTPVRFLLIRRKARDVGSTLDACVICGDQGYYQEGQNVICRNCTAAIYIPTIGTSGGCNPIPLPSTLTESEIVIQTKDLIEGRSWFSHE